MAQDRAFIVSFFFLAKTWDVQRLVVHSLERVDYTFSIENLLLLLFASVFNIANRRLSSCQLRCSHLLGQYDRIAGTQLCDVVPCNSQLSAVQQRYQSRCC
jgi:hypothetical protein